jgi:aspartyl-tRNA(Asn)/glutamyl-tRNA(Gln) amidotransferase subunit C
MEQAHATPEEVAHLAALSRISIPENELATFASEFDAVLAYVSKLDELTLPSDDTTARPAVRNVFRLDGEPHEPGIYSEAIIAQFPEREGNSLSVKQIISHD